MQLQGQPLLKHALHVGLRQGYCQLIGLLPVLCIWHHHLHLQVQGFLDELTLLYVMQDSESQNAITTHQLIDI